MNNRATATFEITGWEETAYDEPVGGPKLSRVTVTKTFQGGVAATSKAELLMCGAADGSAGYIAQERIEGRLGDRSGSFVIHHGGIRGGGAPKVFGHVVPGSGTGELRGLRGEVEYRHDEQGATFTLDYDFE
jgi:hypothetical protein